MQTAPVPPPELLNSAPPNGTVPSEQAGDWLARIRARWLIVAAVLLCSVGAALAMTTLMTKQYAAQAKLQLTDRQPVDTTLQSGRPPSADPERDVNTSLALVTADPVVDRARRAAAPGLSVAALQQKVTATLDGNSNVVVVGAQDTRPARAAAIANALAGAYVDYRVTTSRSQYREALASAQRRLKSLSPAERDSRRGRVLQQRVDDLQATSALQTPGVQLVNQARVPTAAASPNRRQALMIAIVLGLALGAIAAIALGPVRARPRASRPGGPPSAAVGPVPVPAPTRAPRKS
jgi:uncharacterized protein involved in exopolysaccharide biosynthesis